MALHGGSVNVEVVMIVIKVMITFYNQSTEWSID